MSALRYHIMVVVIALGINILADILNAQPWAIYAVCGVYGVYIGALRGKGKI